MNILYVLEVLLWHQGFWFRCCGFYSLNNLITIFLGILRCCSTCVHKMWGNACSCITNSSVKKVEMHFVKSKIHSGYALFFQYSQIQAENSGILLSKFSLSCCTLFVLIFKELRVFHMWSKTLTNNHFTLNHLNSMHVYMSPWKNTWKEKKYELIRDAHGFNLTSCMRRCFFLKHL